MIKLTVPQCFDGVHREGALVGNLFLAYEGQYLASKKPASSVVKGFP